MNRLRISATAVALTAAAFAISAFAAPGAVAAPAPTTSMAQHATGDAGRVLHRIAPDSTGDSGWGGR
jgi:hypothetical protein